VLATIVMGAALWIAAGALEPWFAPPSGTAVRFGALAALVSAGLLVYVVAIFAFGVIDLRQLRSLLRRNSSPGPV
jgi:putative peptidoglycan lipid II flippase